MNNYLFVDAVSYLDTDLLAEHLEKKDKLKHNLKNKRKVNILRWSAVAAAFIMMISIPVVIFLFGKDPIVEELEYTEYFSYSDLTDTINEKTIFENLDYIVDDKSEIVFRLYHDKNNPSHYSALECYVVFEDVPVSIHCYFSSYNNQDIPRPWGDVKTLDIKGNQVNYCEWVDQEGVTNLFANFSYQECQYVIKINDANNIALENILSKLLLEID
jgi:hypothetical protein